MLTRKLGNIIMKSDKKTWQFSLEVSIMNKDEILAKSRAEHKNRDVYEQEVLKQASRSAVVVQMAFAALFS